MHGRDSKGEEMMRPTTQLEKALYQCDLMQDEFIRISHLTDNSEIKGLCERAQIRLKSEVEFFADVDRIRAKARKYDSLAASRDEEVNTMAKQIFMELLRSYHNGIGLTHAASEQCEVARNLAKESYFMALEYQRTINELEKA